MPIYFRYARSVGASLMTVVEFYSEARDVQLLVGTHSIKLSSLILTAGCNPGIFDSHF